MIIRLCLRGKVFYTQRETLEKYPDATLGVALSSGFRVAEQVVTPHGEAYFFDRDPELFSRVILGFYTYGYWSWLPSDSATIIYEELCFWGLAPIAMPECGQDMGDDYPTFVAFVFSTLANRRSMTIPENGISSLKFNPYNLNCAGWMLVIHADQIRSTALRCGVVFDIQRIEGQPQVRNNFLYLQGRSLEEPIRVRVDSSDPNKTTKIGPVKFNVVEKSDFGTTLVAPFDLYGEKCSVMIYLKPLCLLKDSPLA